MSTHGNILIVNEGHTEKTGVWLHAFSNGDVKAAYEMIIALPEWLISRAKLANDLKDPSLGPGWWVRQFNDETWEVALAPYCEIWKANLSSLICARHVNRWCPVNENEAPWHNVGSPAEIVIICSGDSFTVSTFKEEFYPTVEIMWNDRVRVALKSLSSERSEP